MMLTMLGCDPPLAESWLFFITLGFVGMFLIIIFSTIIYKRSWRKLKKLGWAFLILSLPAIYSIAQRNFGEWAELKHIMVAYGQKIKQYEEENGEITNHAEKLKFYELYPNPEFKFSGSSETVWVTYMEWIDSEHKTAISWGSNNCAFNLENMVIVYGD